MPHTIECPSGLRGDVRGLKVKELDLLADRRLAQRGQLLDRILASCWLHTTDPGPYALGDDGRLDWDQVLQGDRFYALLQIRAASFGADYTFAVTCQNDACGHRFEWEVSLDDLPVQTLSDESRERFRAGNRFEAALPGAGKRVWFRLPVGADEKRLAQKRQATGLWSSLLALRVLEVEDVQPAHKRRFLEDLDVADAEHLRAAFEEADCGVDTALEVECPACFFVQRVDLPFDRGFFLAPPSKTRKESCSRA